MPIVEFNTFSAISNCRQARSLALLALNRSCLRYSPCQELAAKLPQGLNCAFGGKQKLLNKQQTAQESESASAPLGYLV